MPFNDVHTWMSEIEKYTADNVPKILIGNKTDLNKKRAVLIEEGQEMADHYGIHFFETSVIECTNVDQALTTLTYEMKKFEDQRLANL